MIIEIEPTSETPIYLQLMFQIKRAVVTGELLSGDTLPSVRGLASELGVNMHTVNKAYNLLNDESVLIKSTKGYTVQVGEKRKANDFLKEEMKNKLEALLVDAFIHQLPEEEIAAWSEVIMKELKKGVETNVDI
ncbi:GntR family transcriptional regulator [Jeotgalibaca porci]|uniref:GntR family transcriptional regulator n=1 Tax=Jeotgalibaca porci TaxID=1868793 RepID=UPI00359F92C9